MSPFASLSATLEHKYSSSALPIVNLQTLRVWYSIAKPYVSSCLSLGTQEFLYWMLEIPSNSLWSSRSYFILLLVIYLSDSLWMFTMAFPPVDLLHDQISFCLATTVVLMALSKLTNTRLESTSWRIEPPLFSSALLKVIWNLMHIWMAPLHSLSELCLEACVDSNMW